VTDINDLFAQLPMGEIAKELGVSKDEAAKGVALALPEAHQRALHAQDRGVKAVDRPARPQPQVRGDLVVP